MSSEQADADDARPGSVSSESAVHDKKLKTYTTLLSTLGAKILAAPTAREEFSADEKAARKNSIDRTTEHHVPKIIRGIECLLVREHEMVCVMPKRLGGEGLLELDVSVDLPDGEESHSRRQTEAALSLTIHITLNPSQKE